MSFDFASDYPLPVKLANGAVITCDVPVSLSVEWDELTDNDWYVSAVYLEGSMKFETTLGKVSLHRLPEHDPLTESIRKWAYGSLQNAINAKWRDYLSDQPKRRRRA